MNNEDTPSTSYYNYIISLLKKDDFLEKIIQKKNEDQWPRNDIYCSIINNIVAVGSKSPIKAIRTIEILTYNVNEDPIKKAIFQVKENDIKFYELLIYFIFADSVIQLLSYTQDIITKDREAYKKLIKNDIFVICNRPLQFKSEKDEIYQKSVSRLVEQCSAFFYPYWILEYFNGDSEYYLDELSSGLSDDRITSKDNLFILYRFIVQSEEYLNLAFQNIKDNDIKKKCVKSYFLQTRKKDISLKNTKLQKFLSQTKNIDALYKSRCESTTIETIKSFINGIGNDKLKLECFSYFLRDPDYKSLEDTWVYFNEGKAYFDVDDTYFLLKEKYALSKYDDKELTDLFFKQDKKFFKNVIGDDIISTKIILNLLSRDLLTNIERFSNKLIELEFPDNFIAPFFRALTIIYDREYFKDGGENILINAKDSKELKTLMEVIQTVYKNSERNEISESHSYCAFISPDECQNLTPNQNVIPQISENGFDQRFTAAQNLTKSIIFQKKDQFNKNFAKKGKKNTLFSLIKKHKDGDINAQIKIYCITILYNILKVSDPTTELFIPLIEMALDKNETLSYFSLYAIQVFYIKREKAELPILSAINHVIKEKAFGEERAFTLLNLLNQLFTLPIFKIDLNNEKESEWFRKWSNEIQAILLVNLLSPYYQVRDMVLLVMENLKYVLEEYGATPNIVTLMHNYDQKMMQRISYRLQTTNNVSSPLINLNFGIICRSTNFLLFIYALVEYAQVLSRESMEGVIKAFYDLNLSKAINKITIDQIPYISFAQRICPMFPSSKKNINLKLDSYTEKVSLKSYSIFDDEITFEDQSSEIVDCFDGLLNQKVINEFCKKLGEKNMDSYNILASLANSLSIELLPSFIKKLSDFLDINIKNVNSTFETTSIDQIMRLGKIINCIVLSSDFELFAYAHMESISDMYQNFINWFMAVKKFIPEDKKFEYVQCFLNCVCSFSDSVVLFKDNVNLLWEFGLRQECFKFTLSLLNSPQSIMAKNTLLKMISSFPIFNDKYKIDEEIYKALIDIEIEDPNANALCSILIHHPSLLNYYFSKSIDSPIQDSFYYFRAISQYFNYNFRDYNLPDINKKVSDVVHLSGKLILTSLILIRTPHDQCRKSAFSLLKCILPILCTADNKGNIENAGNINNYLNQHIKELSIYGIPPSDQQVFELAKCIAENIPSIVSNVFESFFAFFDPEKNDFLIIKQVDNENGNIDVPNTGTDLTVILTSYYSFLLNAVSPFARLLTFKQGKPVYPRGYINTAKNGLQFINDLINIYVHLSKSDIPFYINILYEACHNQDNIQILAKLLVMNANSLNTASNPNLFTVTSTFLFYLIQKVDSAEFLSFLVDHLSFEFWFANTYGSKKILTKNPYNLLDWFDLTLNVIREVALADFSRLFPYIHRIIHYCLIFNNYNEKTNLALSSMLPIIFKNLGVNVSIPEDVKIGFYGRTSPGHVSISFIVKKIVEPLGKLFPASIKSWKDDARQWAANCGDLILAGNSAVIYSYLKVNNGNNYKQQYNDNYIIIQSILDIIKDFNFNYATEHFDEYIRNHLINYFYGVLKMIHSNINFTQNEKLDDKWETMLNLILDISTTILCISDVNIYLSRLALEIIKSIIVYNPKLIKNFFKVPDEYYNALKEHEYKEALDEYYENKYTDMLDSNLQPFSRLMVNSFNETRLVQVFAKIIEKDSKESKLKNIFLGFLLMHYYAAASAYYFVNPYLTFVNDNLITMLNKIAEEFKNSDLDENYRQIFEKFFPERTNGDVKFASKTKPIDFILEMAHEIWKADCVANIMKFYIQIINTTYLFNHKKDDDQSQDSGIIIRDIIFEVTKAFIERCPEDKKEQIPAIFNKIISFAIFENTKAAMDLLATNSKVFYEPKYEDDTFLSIIEIPQNEKSEDSQNSKSKDIFVSFSIIKNKIVDRKGRKEEKTLMIFPMFVNHLSERIKEISEFKCPLYEEQAKFWDEIQKERLYPDAIVLDMFQPLELFAHARAETPIQKSTDELFASKEFFDPESFIIKNDEFEDYEKRLKNQ